MLDGGFELDIDAVHENIANAEVVTLYFPMLRKTLLVDTRTNEAARPYIGVIPMARNATERFESLKKLRPQLPHPDSITMIPWARRIGTLDKVGVWERLLARLVETGDSQPLERARDCLRELYILEQQELGNAIRGHQYKTVWQNPELGPAVL
jgi:hypothetical protein